MEDGSGYYRGRGIPAFGEWNYGDHGEDAGDDWSVLTERFESAMRTPFPVHKPCKRARAAGRRRRVRAFGEWNNHSDPDAGGWTAAVVNHNQCFEPVTAHKSSFKQELTRYDSGILAMGKQHNKVATQTWEAGSVEPFSFTAVKVADDDLYEVPSHMLCAKPLRKGRTWLRSLLMRCCGLNCFT